MRQFHSYYLAKILMVLRIPSFKECEIDATSQIGYDSSLSYVKIGRYSYTAARNRIIDAEIGNFCSIGQNVAIGGNAHPMEMVSTSPVFLKGRNPIGKNLANIEFKSTTHTTIGNDVWIGDNAFIKSGVRVGDGAIIGAHAVVTRDVEPYTIVAGNPAKEIRKRFSDEIINGLLHSHWWELDDSTLRKYSHLMDNPTAFLEAINGKI